jgi:carbamoyltransferase
VGVSGARRTPLSLGLGGVTRHACAAIADDRRVLAVCEQERVTRVRGAGFNAAGLPDEAIDTIVGVAGVSRGDIARYAIAEPARVDGPWSGTTLDHHHGHACAAYLTSPYDAATIVICDHGTPGVSVWRGEGSSIERVDWPWNGASLADFYTECSTLLGFPPPGGDQRFESLARMMAASPDQTLPALFTTDGHRVTTPETWRASVADRTRSAADIRKKAQLAAALQAQIADVLVALLRCVRKTLPAANLCLGGGLFHHSSINTVARQCGAFERVFIPVNPGNAGLAVGAAMHDATLGPAPVSAFLGPSYDAETDIKATLDNCKLRYDLLGEGAAIATAIHHLQQGRLVGWFEGRMEWGPRALGARAILANPFSPYVLENLNRFLKRREAWRGYALSATAASVSAHFAGPDEAPFMECDYHPKDAARFRHVMPAEASHLRVQTVTADCPPRFRALLEAFGSATGIPCLLNTSFNGFHEPIVCTPRDAVRVFFGSGLDVLMLDRFVLTK